ncbi:hypothetical protein C8J56DRAFT_1043236 [Mycena floridula]|nr:hypothetical protein C8J56DRAFT_1043236 [Mycena floridula]
MMPVAILDDVYHSLHLSPFSPFLSSFIITRLIRAHQAPRRASKSTFRIRCASSLNRSMMMATTTNPPTPEATLGLDAHLVTTDALHFFHPPSPFSHPLTLTGSTTPAPTAPSIKSTSPA